MTSTQINQHARTANLAKLMLHTLRPESIACEHIFALMKDKFAVPFGLDINVAIPCADRTIALDESVLIELWTEDLEFDGTAVAVAFVPFFLCSLIEC
jgi:hypothetical protein